MNDSLKILNTNIEKLISDYFRENEKSIEEINKENEELRNKIKELEYELKLSQLKVENLQLKLELSSNREESSNHCADVAVTTRGVFSSAVSSKRQFGKRLFANNLANPNPERMCSSEILVRDTCAMFQGDRSAAEMMESSRIENDENDGVPPVVVVVYESQLIETISDDDDDDDQSNKDDQLSVETQLSPLEEEEKEMPAWSDCEIDLDETMIDCDGNENENNDNNDNNENEENESPISFTQRTPDKSIKFVGPTVRKKSERQGLVGFDCVECRKYYEALGETDSQIQSRIQQCSKHRARNVPPSTPEGFWNIGIAEPAEEPEVKLIKLGGRRGKKMELPDRKWIR